MKSPARSFLLNVILVTTCALAPISWSQARTGGDISGGGNGCSKPQSASPFFLLDFAELPAKMPGKPTLGGIVLKTYSLKRVNVQHFEIQTSPASQLLNQRLIAWQSPANAHWIEKILKAKSQLVALGTDFRIKLKSPPMLDRPALCSEDELETVALYFDQKIMVSIPAWEKLDLLSQAGLLLHESLRIEQISHNLNVSAESEKDLRQFVAHLMLENPGESADFNFEMRAEKIFYSKFTALAQMAATSLQQFCSSRKQWLPAFKTTGLRLLTEFQNKDCYLHPENTPMDFRPTEDRFSGGCMLVNGVYNNVNDDEREKQMAALGELSDSLQSVHLTPASIEEGLNEICGEPLTQAWYLRNHDFLNQLSLGLSYSSEALDVRAIDTRKIVSKAAAAGYTNLISDRAMQLIFVETYFSILRSFDFEVVMIDSTQTFKSMDAGLYQLLNKVDPLIRRPKWTFYPWSWGVVDSSLQKIRDAVKSMVDNGFVY